MQRRARRGRRRRRASARRRPARRRRAARRGRGSSRAPTPPAPAETPSAVNTPARRPPSSVFRIVSAVSWPGVTITSAGDGDECGEPGEHRPQSRSRSASTASRSRSVSSFARRSSAWPRSTGDRLADDDAKPREADRRATNARPCRRSGPGRAAHRSASASLAAPRCHVSVSRTTPSGKIPTSSPSRAGSPSARHRVAIAAAAVDGDPAHRLDRRRRRAGTATARSSRGSAPAAASTRPSRNGSSTDSWFAARIAGPARHGVPRRAAGRAAA